jgi:ATP-dependent DNA helicase RecG
LYKSKVFKRAYTSTVEIDYIQLNRLILEGTNRSFEELPAYKSLLNFNYLEQKLMDKWGIYELNADILRTLDLYYDKTKYNHVAETLSDDNAFPGIDMVRFGDTIDEFLDFLILKIRLLKRCEKSD